MILITATNGMAGKMITDYRSDRFMVEISTDPKVLISLQDAMTAYEAGDWYKVHALVKTAITEMVESSGARDIVLSLYAWKMIGVAVELANHAYEGKNISGRKFISHPSPAV